MLCAAPTVLIAIANAPEELRRDAPTGVRVIHGGRAPGRRHHRADRGRAWLDDHAGLRPHRDGAVHHRLRAATEHEDLSPRERAIIKARQGVELITSGELLVVDEVARGASRRPDARRDRGPRQRGDGGLLQRPRGHGDGVPWRLLPHGRRGRGAPRRICRDTRPHQGRHHQRRREHLVHRGRGCAAAAPRVQEVAVVGMPHEQWGESPHAFVVLSPAPTRPRTSYASLSTTAWRISRPPAPSHFVDELPKTATGKIQKFVLRGSQAAIAQQ